MCCGFCLRRDLVDLGEIAAAKAAFRDYYVVRGAERIAQRVKYYAPKVGVPAGKLEVRELGNRWASCSPAANIAFHWKCMMAPQTIIDYIVVHEWLKKNGAAMDV
jgi:predicted metal-dependent hydrolase